MSIFQSESVKRSLYLLCILCVSMVSFGKDNYGIYTQEVDSLELLVKENRSNFQAYNRLSGLISDINPKKGYMYAKEALSIANRNKSEKQIAQAYQTLGSACYYYNKNDSVEYYYLKALALYEKIGDKSNLAYLCRSLGMMQKKQQDKLKYYEQCYQLFKETNDSIGLMNINYKIGVALMLEKKLDEAVSYYNEALDYAKRLENINMLAYIYNAKGYLYKSLMDYSKSLEFYNQAEVYYTKLNHLNGLGSVWANKSKLYVELDSMGLAVKYIEKCINFNREYGVKGELLLRLGNACSICIQNKDFSRATKFNEEREQLANELGDTAVLINVFYNKGNIAFSLNNYSKASLYYTKAMDLANAFGERNSHASLWKDATLSFILDNNKKMAHKVFVEYNTILDSNLIVESAKKLNELEVKYETKLKEQEIQKLSAEKAQQTLQLKNERKNRLLLSIGALLLIVALGAWALLYRARQKQKRTELDHKKSDIENKLLRSQMNPHFLFNSLNSVQNFILKNDKMEACNYLSDFSDLMRNILQNSRMSFIPLDEELETLGKYLHLEQLRFKGKMEYEITTDINFDASEINIPPMVLQPYIENAIIHGITPKTTLGNLKVHIAQMGNEALKCTVSDNGVGRKAASINKKPSNAKSLGMMVTGERLKQLNREYGLSNEVVIHDLYENEKAIGTKVEVVLPIEKLN